uniref:transmembrane and coiled-coil domain-containing protein 4 isoform X2 n=1 Tax=Myxine glutinosa TaxID=7769 RepID=UPI00358F1DF2
MDTNSHDRESWKPGQRDRSLIGRLSEPSRFCCAAVCATCMGHLYPEPGNRTFCCSFTNSLVTELALPDHVQPIMESFATGHGSEGIASFVEQICSDPALEIGSIQLCQDLLSFALRDGCYDARARVLIRHVAQLLHVSNAEVDSVEEQLVQSLCAALPENEADRTSRLRHEKKKKFQRYFLIGLATAVGGTVIGLTGGLAAPLVAVGAGAVIGSAGAAALGSVAGIAIMTSLFGAAGAGLAGYKMKKRIGKIEEFEFIPLTPGSTLHLTIAITGWLSAGKYGSFQAPWSNLQQSHEQYCLVWESQYLLKLGNAFESIINGLVNMAAQEALKFTVLSGIIAALAWPASLIAAASLIDNPWAVCVNRAAETGKQLARVLLSREQGQRPVSLIGFSLGARVIFYCLQEMSKAEGGVGLLEDVILLGAPAPGSATHWQPIVHLVAGRIINGYCRGDWLLKFLYRSSSAELSVAGLQPLELENHRIFNVNLTTIVDGHLDYNKKMDVILKTMGVKTREALSVDSKGLGQLVCLPGGAEKATAAEHSAEKMHLGMEKQEVGVWVITDESEVQEIQKGKNAEQHEMQEETEEEHGMQKETEDDHAMQKETEDDHRMQKETEDEHAMQKETEDEHAMQNETEDEHAMQKETEDVHEMQKETEDEHEVQKQAEDEHEVQKQAEDEHAMQKETEDEHEMQKETVDEHEVQKQAEDEHEVQKQAEDEHEVQKQAEDEHGMQKETEDVHAMQKETEDVHEMQKETEDEHEVQKQAEDEHGMQKETEDEHAMQKETEDVHEMQKETEDEHEVQKQAEDEHEVQKQAEDEHAMQKGN